MGSGFLRSVLSVFLVHRAAAASFCGTPAAGAGASSGSGWRTVWSEEFDEGAELDTRRWSKTLGNDGTEAHHVAGAPVARAFTLAPCPVARFLLGVTGSFPGVAAVSRAPLAASTASPRQLSAAASEGEVTTQGPAAGTLGDPIHIYCTAMVSYGLASAYKWA